MRTFKVRMNKMNLGLPSSSMGGIAGICWRLGCLPGTPAVRLPLACTLSDAALRSLPLWSSTLQHDFNATPLLPTMNDVWCEPTPAPRFATQRLGAPGAASATMVASILCAHKEAQKNFTKGPGNANLSCG
jgi:hypothetical protein